MNSVQKQAFVNWSRRKRINDNGRNHAVSTVMVNLFFKFHDKTKTSFEEYIKNVHPLLIFYCLGDWSKDGTIDYNVWKGINKEWIEICYLQKFWRYEELHIYNSFDTLKENLNNLFNNVFISDSNEALSKLVQIEQNRINSENVTRQNAIDKAKEDKEKAELLLDTQAQRKASDALRKLKQEQEASDRVQLNRSIASGSQIWNQSVTTSMKHLNKPATQTLGDIMDISTDIMDSEPAYFLMPVYYHPTEMEVSLVKELGSKKEYNLLEFGEELTKAILDSSFTTFRLSRDPQDNEIILYFSNREDGIPYQKHTENGKIYLQVFCKSALDYFFKDYGKDIKKLILSKSTCERPGQIAFKVEDYALKNRELYNSLLLFIIKSL